MNGAGRKPRTELTLMIRPLPCSRMWGSTARVIRIEPKTLVSNSARVCSIELSSAAPAMPKPALLTRTSIRPDRSSTSRTTPSTDPSSVTSSGRNTTPPRSSPAAALRLVPYTVNPAPTSARAAASPIPADAPVTSATGRVSRAMIAPSLDCITIIISQYGHNAMNTRTGATDLGGPRHHAERRRRLEGRPQRCPGESSPGTWCRSWCPRSSGRTFCCSGCCELWDLLLVEVGLAMEPLLEKRLHRGGGQVAATDEPLIVLLEAEHADEPDQGAVVGEDADDVGAAADLLVEALEWVRAPQLRPVRWREGIEGEDVLLGVGEHAGDLRQPLLERRNCLAEPFARLLAGVGLEDRPNQRGQQSVLVAAGVAEAVAQEVHRAALPGTAKQPGDRRLEPLVGIGDDELHARKAARDQ